MSVQAEAKKAAEALVLQATHEALGSTPDYGVNVQIVDLLNSQPESGEVVAKTLKKQLKAKSNVVALLAISLVDMLIKGCPQFHKHVANKDFMDSFIKTLPDKIREPQKKSLFKLNDNLDVNASERVDRTLLLIETWAKAFSKSRSFPIFKEKYDELLGKGVKFPEPLKDELAPVFTPPVNAAAKEKEKEKAKEAAEKAATAARDAPFRDGECAAASENAKLLYDMLTASQEGSDLARDELVQTLLVNVRASQASLMSRLSQPMPDWQMAELLRANDFCAESMQYYQGLVSGQMKRRPRVTPEQKAVAAAGAASTSASAKKEDKRPTALAPPPSAGGDDEEEEEEDDEPAKSAAENKRPPAAAATVSPTTNVLDFFSGAPAAATPAPQLQPTPQKATPSAAQAGVGSVPASSSAQSVTVPKIAPPKLAPPPVTPSSKAGRSSASPAAPITPAASAPTPQNTPAQPAQPPASSAINLDFLFGALSQPQQPTQQQPQPQPFMQPAARPAQPLSPFDLIGGPVAPVATSAGNPFASAPASRFPPAFPSAQPVAVQPLAPVAAQPSSGGNFDDDFDPFSQIAARKPGAVAASKPAVAAPAAAEEEDDPFAAIASRKA